MKGQGMKVENVDSKDNQQIIIQSNNYNVTVIPVEYSRSRGYSTSNSDYVLEQYSEYPNHVQSEDISSGQGSLYSVSQRIPTVAASYSNLCTADSSAYAQDQASGYSSLQTEWEKDRSTSSSESKKDSGFSDGTCDKQHDISSASTLPLQTPPLSATTSSSSPESLQGPVIPVAVYLHNRTAVLLEIEDTPSATCDLICQAIVNCDELGLNKQLAAQVFTLWISSPLLELQLKPTHRPYEICQAWRKLLLKYCHASYNKQRRDEPKLLFQRNLFFPRHLEEKIKDQKVLELLYEEARHNILNGRYPCEIPHYIMLGGIQAREELGPYNPQVHSTHYFREEQSKYLPAHVRKSSAWTWLPISSKNSAEVRLLEQFKRIPSTATNRKLVRKYLEFCWSLPFYGSAFFEGQVEQPVRGLTSLLTHQDIPVLVGINARGVHIIDDLDCQILLGLRYEEFNWEYAKPGRDHSRYCLPCLFLQFMVVENGARVSKILQIFSRQAELMDKLITAFVGQIKGNDEGDGKVFDANTDENNPPILTNTYNSNYSALSNKLNRLTLATFDEDGHCIGQMGSWSMIY